MKTGGPFIAIAALLLSGCIPGGSARSPEAVAPPPLPTAGTTSPRIDPDFSAVTREKPIWELRPVTANALTIDGKRYHRVAPGETGIAIARAYGITWSRLIEANGLTEPFVIKAGQRLLLPGGSPAPSMEARARAFRLNIDDILTGGEPAKPASASTGASVPPVVTAPARFSGQFYWPIAGRVASRFGPAGSGRINQGIDIAAPSGGAITATADGTVAFVGDGVPGYGGLILIRHGGGWISAYGFTARATVKRGDTVKRGSTIGRVSVEANPALHFELRRDRRPVDPLIWLPKR